MIDEVDYEPISQPCDLETLDEEVEINGLEDLELDNEIQE